MKNKKVVLVGGCFDILHPGHVIFLQKAKKMGDKLVVLLESDEKIKQLKGKNRPFFNQTERATVLKGLKFVDQIIMLPNVKSDADYEKVIIKLKPDIIAATKGSSDNFHKERIAKIVGAKLKYVSKIIGSYSTTKILNHKLGI